MQRNKQAPNSAAENNHHFLKVHQLARGLCVPSQEMSDGDGVYLRYLQSPKMAAKARLL